MANVKLPHFFIYAKDKEERQVLPANGSTVNRLEKLIPNKRMNFSAKNVGTFDCRYMMSGDPLPDETTMDTVVSIYEAAEKKYRYAVNFYEDKSNYGYIRDLILKELEQTGLSRHELCDILTFYYFYEHPSVQKGVFWLCFGDVVLRNLQNNIPDGSMQCQKCGRRFIPSAPQQKQCSDCASYHPVGKKVVKCIDCGAEFTISGRGRTRLRCENCQKERDKQKKAERNSRYYNSHKNKTV